VSIDTGRLGLGRATDLIEAAARQIASSERAERAE
jgi:hypothetical protein